MKKIRLLMLLLLFLLGGCENKNSNEVVIMQENKSFTGESISLKKKPFMILFKEKNYQILFSKEPIRVLKNRKNILKLKGTVSAWHEGEVITYIPSTELKYEDMCELYNLDKCNKYSTLIKESGYENETTFTFGSYPVSQKRIMIHRIDKNFIEDIKENYLYLYIFKRVKEIEDISFVNSVQLIKLNFSSW